MALHPRLPSNPTRWIIEILHDPKYLISWEYWDYSTLRSCRIFSINSTSGILPELPVRLYMDNKFLKKVSAPGSARIRAANLPWG